MAEVKQIAPHLFEIPRTGAMRVPGRVYATRELMESAKEDEAIDQVRNVAHLPGIVKYSMAMPDFHWGYGFPIGGVAAFDAEEGVISPGGVGYDINCLSGDTPVLFPDGYTRPIREIVERRLEKPVFTPDGPAQVVAGFHEKPRRRVLEVVTTSGRKIVATEDHPFLTPGGMRELGSLEPGTQVAVEPFEGVPYAPPPMTRILNERKIRRTAERFGRTRGNAIPQILRRLKSLLPLHYDHPAVPALLKLAGLVLGDGSIHFEKRGKGVVTINGKPEDLRRVAEELRPWCKVSRVYSRERRCRIHTTYGLREFRTTETSVHIRSSALAVLLAALEIPVGRKATQDWELPRWVRRAPLWQQRLFLAAFFGAELSAPRGFDRANRSFYCPELTVVKREGFVAGGARFLGQIARLLERFGVTSLTVSKRPEQMNPDGRRSIRLRLVLSNRDENLIRLWSRVGFEYQAKRADLAAAATAYLQRKRAYLRTREHLMRRILEIRAVSGWGAKKIRAALGDAGVHLRFVERTLYGRPERRPRAWDFPTFEEWRRSWVRGGHIWEEIAAKTARDDVRRVYDITVDHPDHRFIAGGFVVHN